MPVQKTPGGSLFPYYYKNGELVGIHYGSFFANEAALLARMQAEEEFIEEAHRQLPMWIDFYDSKLTDKILIEFLKSIVHLRGCITKLAIVGCSFVDRWRLKRFSKRLHLELPMPVRFFNDPEVAKTWLVSEH